MTGGEQINQEITWDIKYWNILEEALEIKMPETESCKEMMRKRQYYIIKESYDCPSNKHLVPMQINLFTDGSKTLRLSLIHI